MLLLLSAIFGGGPPGDDDGRYAGLIADNLGFIEERCRRAYGIASRWQQTENVPAMNKADALLVEVLDHLRADGFRVLREFKGRSSVRRYLEVVIANKVVDLYRSKEGRSRAAEEARKMGSDGVRLYELAFIDGLPIPEAHRVMVDETGFAGGLDALEDMAERIRARMTHAHAETPLGQLPEKTETGARLRVVKDDFGGLTVPDDSLGPERALDDTMREGARAAALGEIARLLSPQEKLMAKMRFNGGMKIKEVAAALGMSEKAAYRAFEAMLARCRKALSEKGLGPGDLL